MPWPVLRAIIFDFIGVLAEDEATHFVAFQQALREHGLALKDKPPLFPGAVDFVKRAGARYRLAIASSGTREQIRFALAGTPIEKDFQVTVAAEDISVGKPDPEIYRLTLALLNQTAPLLESEVRSEYCVIIEDSLAGIQAGLAAGMKVAAISTTYPAAHLGHAHLVIPCLNVATLENLESLFPSSQSDRSGP